MDNPLALGSYVIGKLTPASGKAAFSIDFPQVNTGKMWIIKRYTVNCPDYGFSSGTLNYQSGLYLCTPGQVGSVIPSSNTFIANQFPGLLTIKLDNSLSSISNADRNAILVSFGKPIIVPELWFVRALISNGFAGSTLNAPATVTLQYEEVQKCP